MKKETIRTQYFENIDAIADLEMNVEHFQKLIQNSLNAWDGICKVPLTLKELESLLILRGLYVAIPENIEALLREKIMMGRKCELDGLAVDRDQLKAMLKLPDLSVFMQSLEKFADPIPSKTVFAAEYVYWHFYVIEKGKVQVLTDAIEVNKNSLRRFATTPDELKRLKSVMQVCDSLNSFIKENPEVEPFDLCIRNLIIYDGKYYPSSMFIENGRF